MPPVLLLRRYWLGFAVLILLGLLSDIFLTPFWLPSSIYSEWIRYQFHFRGWRIAVVAGHAALFGIMVAATYTQWRLLWWATIFILSVKLYRLLKYYALHDVSLDSTSYNRDYMALFDSLAHLSAWLRLPAELLLGNHLVSAVFLVALYGYWLVQCRKHLQATTGDS